MIRSATDVGTGKPTQVNHDVGKGIEIADRGAIADLGALDAQGFGLGDNALVGHALAVDLVAKG